MVSYSSVCPALGLLLALSAFCSAQQAATQNPVAVAEAQNKYSKQVSDCIDAGTGLDKCLVDVTKIVQPETTKGVPEIEFPSLLPHKTPKVPVNIKSSTLELNGTLTDVETRGMEFFEMIKVVPGQGTNAATINFKVKDLTSTGKYELDGLVILLPLHGKGNFNLTLKNIIADAKITLGRQGANSVKFESYDVAIQAGSGSIKLDGLQGEGDTVGEAINNMLNDNFPQLSPELEPIYKAVASDVIKRSIAMMISGLPLDAFTKAGLKI